MMQHVVVLGALAAFAVGAQRGAGRNRVRPRLELFPIEVNRRKSPGLCFSEHLYPIEKARRSDDALAGTQRETKTNNSAQWQNIGRDNIRVTVKHGAFIYKWGVPLNLTVGEDGAFTIQSFFRSRWIGENLQAFALASILIRSRKQGDRMML